MFKMSSTEIYLWEEVVLNNPVFIESLPDIGHVGRLAVDRIIDEL